MSRLPYKKGGEKKYHLSANLSISAARRLQALSLKFNKNKGDIISWLLEPFPDPVKATDAKQDGADGGGRQ